MPTVPANWLHTGPFRLDRIDGVARLREVLHRANYTESSIGEIVLRDSSGKPLDAVSLRRRLAEPSTLNTLLRLFVLAAPVAEEDVRPALEGVDVDSLADAGLLTRTEAGLRAAVALMPEDDLLMAREHWPEFSGVPIARDHVSGAGLATRMVSHLTVRRSDEKVLDLGTGTGYQALMAARHARQVAATDINPRALNFAAFNARLNDLPNVEFRQGSLFEPVADERFDLIVSNPPFVISPESRYEYRDSGMPGDRISEQVLRRAPAMLAEGGYCTVLFNWHHKNEDDWPRRPQAWLNDCGCDAWLLQFSASDPIAYAATWLLPDCGDRADEYGRRLDAWLEYFKRLEIGLVTFGAVVLRRRSGVKNWFRAEEAPSREPPRPCGEQIQRIFAAQDVLEEIGSDDDRLLQERFVLTPDHQLHQLLHADNGRWVVEGAHVRQTSGFPAEGNVDRLVSTVLAGCNGQHTLWDLVADLSQGLHRDPGDLIPGCCRVIRSFLHWGFLTRG